MIQPSKIVCVGKNYAKHAAEMGGDVPAEPLIFLKPPSSLLAEGRSIVIPDQSREVHYEGEIGVIIEIDAEDGLVWVRVDSDTDPRLPDHPDVASDRMPVDPALIRARHCSAC